MKPSRRLTTAWMGSVSPPPSKDLVMDLITKILQRKTDGGTERINPRKPRPDGNDKPFSRTNRVEGQMKWVHELRYMLRAKHAVGGQVDVTDGLTPSEPTLGLAVIVDLAKELLYSGIPEQVLQLYGAYCDLILLNEEVKDAVPTAINSKDAVPTATNSKVSVSAVPLSVVPNSKLLAVISRAFIAMHDVKGALSLLQSSSRRGVLFDDEAKSLLMADLAQCSAEGLSAALQLRQQMLDRAEAVGAKGSAGILRGLHMHVLSSYEEEGTGTASRRGVSARTLLVDCSAKPADVFVNEEEQAKKMNASTAEAIAIDVADKYFHRSERQQLGRPRHHHSVSIELLRVVFRSSVMLKDSSQSKAARPRDRLRYSVIDFELDEGMEREERALAGLHAALSIMQRYGLRWDQQIADTLLDECLRVGDVTGMRFVAQRMWEEGIPVRTSTCNALLRRYAEDGDAEGAYSLVHGVMKNCSIGTRSSVDAQLTAPNSETWTLLLQACLPTRKGRFVGKTVIDELLHTDEAATTSSVVTKQQWDLILEHSVLSAGDRQLVEPRLAALLPDYSAVLCRMVTARSQPDDSSMRALYRSFLRTRDVESALHLYRMQLQGEQVRASFWSIASKQLSSIGSHQAAAAVEHSTLERRVLSMYQNYSSLLLKVSNKCSYSHGESEDDILTPNEQKIQLEMLVSMCLPPLSIGSINALLELLSMHGHYSRARSVLRDICTRAKPPPRPSNSSFNESLLKSPQLLPDRASFALVIEACLRDSEQSADSSSSTDSSSPPPPNPLPVVLNLVRIMETDFGLRPDRRIYAALIRAFGQRGDASSALGVFQEMRQYYFPDVGTLQSILDVCLRDPTGADLLRMCPVLEDMAEQRDLQLEVYSKDVLMEGFPDGRSLGAALLAMEATTRPGQPFAEVSLCVLSVLAQAVRSSLSVGSTSSAKALQLELESSLAVLGAAGVRLEKETREYFRIPEEPALNSPNSRHYHRLFVPQKRKQRSLLDIDMPLGLRPDLDVPLRGYSPPLRETAELEGRWSGHAKTMAALIDGAVYEAEQFSVEEQARSTQEEERDSQDELVSTELVSTDSDSDGAAPIDDLRDAFKQQIKPPKRTALDMWVPKAAAAAAASLRTAKSQSVDSPRLKEQLLLESRKHQTEQQQRVRKPPQQSSSVKVLVMKSKSR